MNDPGGTVHGSRTQILIDTIAGQIVRNEDEPWPWKILQTDRDWEIVVRTACDEGLAPLFFARFRETNILSDLPENIGTLLRNAYVRTSAVNEHILAFLEELGDVLEQRGVPVIVLKGTALLNTVYRDIGLRPMDDIDVMIQTRHKDDICKILTGMGFIRDRVYTNSFQRGVITIDLHTDFISSERIHSRKDTMTIREDDIWRNAVPFNGSSVLYRLSPYDTLIALSFHLLKHRFNRLIWLVDIATFMTSHTAEVEWRELTAYARSLDADRFLLYAVILAKHLAGANIPDHALIRLGKEKLTFIERYILRLHVSRTPLGTITDVLWIFQIRGVKKRIRFVVENIFPRPEIMDQIMSPSSHRIGTFVRRSVHILVMIISEVLSSVMHVMREGLPRL